MSAPKYLIDTNVFIGLEDAIEVSSDFSSLIKLASKHGVGIFVHEASRDDVDRDRDINRRKISLSKIEKFQLISKVKNLRNQELAEKFGSLNRPNDVVDATLLHALNIGVADFLVTEDGGIHDRVRKYAPYLAGRVLFVADATQLLRSTYEPVSVPLRFVEEVDAHAIPLNDPIFNSLRDGYPDFDLWWTEKCIKEMRKCWVVVDEGKLTGIVVRKDETPLVTENSKAPRRVLKICTFKVTPEKRGIKLGELLIKQILWFAQKNSYDLTYLTTYPSQTALIRLIEYYGFVKTAESESGELTFEKVLSRDPLPANNVDNLFTLAARSYPRFHFGPKVEAYCIPILPEYHRILFPELSTRSDLFESFEVSLGNRLPGNTIRKVYVCRAKIKNIEPGSIMFFYVGRSALEPSQAITTVGIFENIELAHSTDNLRRLVGGRSVYTDRQLIRWGAKPERPVKVINFLLSGHLSPPMECDELFRRGVFVGHQPQSICWLPRARMMPLLDRIDFGFSLV